MNAAHRWLGTRCGCDGNGDSKYVWSSRFPTQNRYELTESRVLPDLTSMNAEYQIQKTYHYKLNDKQWNHDCSVDSKALNENGVQLWSIDG